MQDQAYRAQATCRHDTVHEPYPVPGLRGWASNETLKDAAAASTLGQAL